MPRFFQTSPISSTSSVISEKSSEYRDYEAAVAEYLRAERQKEFFQVTNLCRDIPLQAYDPNLITVETLDT